MNKYLSLAIKLSEQSRARQKHGAVLVKGGRIISSGINMQFFSPTCDGEDWRASGLHAEQIAILSAGNKAKGATLYVARTNKYGTPMLSAPCLRCKGLIGRKGITKVVFTE